jgi:arylsulfatase A-like enzyme
MDAAGGAYPKSYGGQQILPMEGRSLRPAFAGKKIPRSDAFYWEHEGNRAVIDGRWKLVSRYPNRWELYDLEADRCEQRDLASADATRAARMESLYHRWAERCNVRPWEEVRRIPANDTGG